MGIDDEGCGHDLVSIRSVLGVALEEGVDQVFEGDGVFLVNRDKHGRCLHDL